jgi:hypothetical protein
MFQESRFTATAFAGAAGGHDQPAPHVGGTVVPLTAPRPAAAATDGRYADLADRVLAEKLASEDAAVEAGLSPFERLTCPAHRRWIHQCIASPQHVSPVTGHRWCRDCQAAVTVAVDELVGDVSLTCPRCHRAPEGIATRQIVRACRASLATVHDMRTPTAQRPELVALDGRRAA